MKLPTQNDINRIYSDFNVAYQDKPERYDFNEISHFCDKDTGVHLGLNGEIASGYWELYRPSNDMLICIAEGLYHAKYQQKILPTEDILTLRFVLSGNYSITVDKVNKLEIPQASASIIYAKKGREFELSIDEGSHQSTVTVHIKPESFYDMFDIVSSKLPSYLTDILFDRKISRQLYNFPLSAGMMNIILDLLRMRFTGARRRLFTEAKTSELVCRLFQEVEDDYQAVPVMETPEIALNKKLYAAQSILVENYRSAPTLRELARQVGLNKSTLCAGFKKNFGTTIFGFVQKYRMDKARELLKDRNLNISQVADLVGYDHATNFTTAFKRQFGFLPKEIRHN